MRDPGNEVLIEQSFLMELMEGNWPRTEQLARELPSCSLRVARRMPSWASSTSRRKRYAEADEHFKAASANPIGELTSTLARAWLYQAQDKTQEALAPSRCAQAARVGPVLSALSSRPACRSGRAPRRGARRLRAHPQERPAHAAHHAGLRAARGQRRRCQAGAERAEGARSSAPRAKGIRLRVRCRSRSRPASARTCSSTRPPRAWRRHSTGWARRSRAKVASASAPSTCSSRST